MKAEITITLDIPDKYLFDDEYAERSLQQFVWKHSVHELQKNYLQKLYETGKKLHKAENSNNINEIVMEKKLVNYYEDMTTIFAKCKYEIRKIET